MNGFVLRERGRIPVPAKSFFVGMQTGGVNVNFQNRGFSFQIGLFNRSYGGAFQIGLLNYAENAWIPWLPVINFCGFSKKKTEEKASAAYESGLGDWCRIWTSRKIPRQFNLFCGWDFDMPYLLWRCCRRFCSDFFFIVFTVVLLCISQQYNPEISFGIPLCRRPSSAGEVFAVVFFLKSFHSGFQTLRYITFVQKNRQKDILSFDILQKCL